jgi:hypothetical protein
MTLAVMVATDEDALVCDFAETYHILDYRALPWDLRAVLASGLRENSRIKMKLAGFNYIPPEIIYPQMADHLNMIRYAFTEDAKHRRNTPELLTDILQGKQRKKETAGFRSAEDFWAARERILTG